MFQILRQRDRPIIELEREYHDYAQKAGTRLLLLIPLNSLSPWCAAMAVHLIYHHFSFSQVLVALLLGFLSIVFFCASIALSMAFTTAVLIWCGLGNKVNAPIWQILLYVVPIVILVLATSFVADTANLDRLTIELLSDFT